MSPVYDAGVLIAADRDDRRVWADHRAWLELGVLPTTTAPVVAQACRSPRQVQLRRFLRGCAVEPFTPQQGRSVGDLLGRTGTADVVDAHLVMVASLLGSDVITSDPDDIERIAKAVVPAVSVRRL